MEINMKRSNELQKRAQKVIPLGVNSNFRYWGQGITPYVKKAKGGYLWDVDDIRYIDYRLGFGPIILGHSYEEVDAKVLSEIANGTLFAMTGELEVALAEKIVAMCPAVEMVRLACSGTEATMHALRIARAYTGREKEGHEVRRHVPRLPGLYPVLHLRSLPGTREPPQPDPGPGQLWHSSPA